MNDKRYREGLPPVPEHMRHLPIDPRGFPVPWFTPWDDRAKAWDFQAIEPRKMMLAVQQRACWVCGRKLFKNMAFVLGPMCCVTRTISEPPSHVECAEFSATACPFLTKPRMRRQAFDPDKHKHAAGLPLQRNPGVVVVWVTRRYEPFHPRTGGILFKVGAPIRQPVAYSEGREATKAELIESIRSGLPSLAELAWQDGPGAMQALADQLKHAWGVLGLAGEPFLELPRPDVAAERQVASAGF